MKMKFIGCGSALKMTGQYDSNVFIEDGDDNILIDAGRTAPEALKEADISVKDIKNIFITHNHGDHTGSLEFIGFDRYFGTFPFGEDKPRLFGYVSTLDDLWDHNLSAGMKSLQGMTATLDTYYNTEYLQDNEGFSIGETGFEIVQTIHVIDDRRIMPSHGLLIYAKSGKKVFFTGDSQCAPNQMLTFYQKADVIFHDCELANYPNSVHAQYHELKELPSDIKAKMWLYHYTESDDMPNAVEEGFLGFVHRGQEFEF